METISTPFIPEAPINHPPTQTSQNYVKKVSHEVDRHAGHVLGY